MHPGRTRKGFNQKIARLRQPVSNPAHPAVLPPADSPPFSGRKRPSEAAIIGLGRDGRRKNRGKSPGNALFAISGQLLLGIHATILNGRLMRRFGTIPLKISSNFGSARVCPAALFPVGKTPDEAFGHARGVLHSLVIITHGFAQLSPVVEVRTEPVAGRRSRHLVVRPCVVSSKRRSPRPSAYRGWGVSAGVVSRHAFPKRAMGREYSKKWCK